MRRLLGSCAALAVISAGAAGAASGEIGPAGADDQKRAGSTTPPTSAPINGAPAPSSGSGTASPVRQIPFAQVKHIDSTAIPSVALTAYQRAAQVISTSSPACHLSWSVLAGIGRVESDHGHMGRSKLGAKGVATPAIVGPALDGRGGVERVADTDAGALDHDTRWDRAIGPMQLIPSTWRAVMVDGDGDGVRNPQDIDDSTLGAAVFLCAGGANLSTPTGQARAIYRYNPSPRYVRLVLAYARAYAHNTAQPVDSLQVPTQNVGPVPDQAEPAPARTHHGKKHHKKAHKPTTAHHAKHHAHKPKHKAHQAATGPATPPPDPTPTGTLVSCGTGSWCLKTKDGKSLSLDFGDSAQLGKTAAHDYDGDGTPETNTDELNGLVKAGPTIELTIDTSNGVVYKIGTDTYRNPNGSFAPPAPTPSPSPSPSPSASPSASPSSTPSASASASPSASSSTN